MVIVRHLDAAPIAKPVAGEELKANKLFPLGTFHRWDFPKDGITFDTKFLEAMVRNFRKNGRRLPIDYFHRGFSQNDGQPTDDKVAAGWIVDLEIRDDGLWMLNTWTDRAERYILADELAYLSPSFSENATDPKTGKAQGPTLFGAGLLNDPFLQELPRVAASDAPPPADEAKKGDAMKEKICALLGLPVEASDDEVIAKLQAALGGQKEAVEAAAAEAKVLTASRDDAHRALSAAQTALKAKADEVVSLAAKLEKLETEKRDEAIEALGRELVTQGRILATHQDQVRAFSLAMGLDKAKEFFTSLPVTVQLGEAGIAGTSAANEAQAAQAKLDARIAELRKQDAALSFKAAHALALSEDPSLSTIYA